MLLTSLPPSVLKTAARSKLLKFNANGSNEDNVIITYLNIRLSLHESLAAVTYSLMVQISIKFIHTFSTNNLSRQQAIIMTHVTGY